MNEKLIETAFIDPGKRWQNGTNESFNGRFRDEHLVIQWFRTPAEARAVNRAMAPALCGTPGFRRGNANSTRPSRAEEIVA